jgi:hypothetical protein
MYEFKLQKAFSYAEHNSPIQVVTFNILKAAKTSIACKMTNSESGEKLNRSSI